MHEQTFWCALVLPAANLGKVRNLNTCRFLQHYHGAPSPRSHLASPAIWFIDFPMATIIVIFAGLTQPSMVVMTIGV
ncbi:hypothetical protein TNCV_2559481 [Trichonephila clavipes]|nr:hypothetical protein TNCV_2559481 [Trichonephila clavipes]